MNVRLRPPFLGYFSSGHEGGEESDFFGEGSVGGDELELMEDTYVPFTAIPPNTFNQLSTFEFR